MSGDPASAAEVRALLRAAREGEASALGRLLEAYRTTLDRLARRRLAPRLTAKVGASDVVQEAFLQAHRAFPGFRGATQGEFETWLRRILESRVEKQLRLYFGTARRNVRQERALGGSPESSSPVVGRGLAARGTSPSGGAVRGEDARRLKEAMARLPERYRSVLSLRHLEGLTFPEIAERTGSSLGSVEKMWVRALARLRAILGET